MTRKAKRAAPAAKRSKKAQARRPSAKKKPSIPRFVHLGDRLLALERVRAGVTTPTEAAQGVGVTPAELRKWQLEHSRERFVSLAELRPGQGSTLLQRLRSRARRLADLIAASEKVLRDLQRELAGSVGTSRPVSTGRRNSK
jgi:hypothetical protein